MLHSLQFSLLSTVPPTPIQFPFEYTYDPTDPKPSPISILISSPSSPKISFSGIRIKGTGFKHVELYLDGNYEKTSRMKGHLCEILFDDASGGIQTMGSMRYPFPGMPGASPSTGSGAGGNTRTVAQFSFKLVPVNKPKPRRGTTSEENEQPQVINVEKVILKELKFETNPLQIPQDMKDMMMGLLRMGGGGSAPSTASLASLLQGGGNLSGLIGQFSSMTGTSTTLGNAAPTVQDKAPGTEKAQDSASEDQAPRIPLNHPHTAAQTEQLPAHLQQAIDSYITQRLDTMLTEKFQQMEDRLVNRLASLFVTSQQQTSSSLPHDPNQVNVTNHQQS